MRRLQNLILFVLFVSLSFSSCECRKEAPPVPQQDSSSSTGSKRALATIAVTPRLGATAAPSPQAAEPTATVVAALPTDFPKEIPIYKDATLMKVNGMANKAHNVIFSARDSVANVRTFYYKQFQDQGFEVKQEFDRGEHAFATFKKGDLLINVTIANDQRSPGQQIIAIMYEREEPLPFDEF